MCFVGFGGIAGWIGTEIGDCSVDAWWIRVPEA